MKLISITAKIKKRFYLHVESGIKAILFNFREYVALFFLCAGLVFLFSGVIIVRDYVPQKSLTVTFFNVGQGDAVFIESPTRTKLLIDGGPTRVVLSQIDQELPFFERKVDAVLPSHADKDHIVGSIQTMDMFMVTHCAFLHASSSTELDDMYLSRCKMREMIDLVAGDHIDIGGGAVLSTLLPFDDEIFSEKETNESSQAFLLTYQGFSFLFTGDLPADRERYLLESGKIPEKVSVFKLGHHGSKGSSGMDLLQKIKPWYVVVSAGKGNNYGHPNKETLERAERVGSVLLRTDEMGSISFTVNGDTMSYILK